MAIIRACGFEWGTSSELDWIIGGTGVTNTKARTGTYSFHAYNGCYGYLSFAANSEVYIQAAINGAAWNYALYAPILIILGGGGTIAFTFYVNAINQMLIYTGDGHSGGTLRCTGSTTLSLNQWFISEFHLKIDSVNGVIESRIAGLTDCTFYGNTLTGAATTIDTFQFYAGIGGGTEIYWDDIIFCDTSGTLNNAWVDGASVTLLKPTSTGSYSQWEATPPGTTHWMNVDEVPPLSADYISSTTSGTLELFGVEDVPANTGQVLGVITDAWVQRVAGSTTSNLYTATNCPQGLQLSSSKTPGTSFALTRDIYNLNPKTGLRWTILDTNALEVGAKIV